MMYIGMDVYPYFKSRSTAVRYGLDYQKYIAVIVISTLLIFGVVFLLKATQRKQELFPMVSPTSNSAFAVDTALALNDIKSTELTQSEKEKIILAQPHGNTIYNIWILESNKGEAKSGHHLYCSDQGLSNEFGYGVWGKHKTCFESFEESVEAVNNWLNREMESKTISQTLCKWNTGQATESCSYAYNFKRL